MRIKEGPFTDFNGAVEDVNYEKSKVRVVCHHLRPRDPGRAGFRASREGLEFFALRAARGLSSVR